MDKKIIKQFYMHLIDKGIIELPFDEQSFDDYILEEFETEALNIQPVINLLYCGDCENECEHEELSPTALKCLECGNIAVE